ncbi:glycoside hydrolase family 15, partial [candidate division KSB1 bacterium]
TMGLAWLAIIYKKKGDFSKYRFYMQKTMAAMNENGELPELYFANSAKFNENTPLGWAQALYMLAVS